MFEKVFDYVKHYVEVALNIINFKLISKMVLQIFQYAKSLIIFYSDKSIIYKLLMKEDRMSSEDDWDLESGNRTTSPLIGYNDHNNSKNNTNSRNKKGNGNSHKKESSNKLQNRTRNKPEALLPVTNSHIDRPYRIMPDPLKSPSSPDSVTMEIDSDIDSDSTLTPTDIRTSNIPNMEIRSREAVVEIMEKSIPNYEKMSSQNTFDYSQELSPSIPMEHSIDYKSVQNYNPYLTISTTSFPLPSLKEDSLSSPVSYQMNEDIHIFNKPSLKNESFMKMPSSIDDGQVVSSFKAESLKSLEDDKKIKGILVNKTVTENIDNDGGAFEVVNKKRGKRTHKHSLSFSVPLTSTIEVPLRTKSHKRSSSSSTNIASKNIESISVNNAIIIGNSFNTIDDNVSYSNAVQYSRKQLRKRSISTPIMLDKEQSSQEKISHSTNNIIASKKVTSATSVGTTVNHIRRYSTSIIDNKLSYADVLNSNLHINEDDVLENANSLKKNTKINKNATTRSGGSPTGNAENTKNQPNGNDNSNDSSEQNNNSDQNYGQDDNGGNTNSNSNGSGNNGNNNGNNNNNNNNTNPNTGRGKNKKQKKAKNANGTADDNENEEMPGTPKKKAAKAKKETKGKNKVAVDTASQGKANGNELKSPPASKKKAAKAAANAKKKEASKSTEESGLLVTGEITYGKAGLQDEPIPTDEEAYNALFSENATYWTPAERTERIRNSPFYDHNHHIAKYGKIKYKPMVEYDTDMNEINYELEMDEAANEKGKKEDKKEKKKKKKANANANVASTSDDKDASGTETKKGKKKKTAKDDEDNEETADEKITKSKKKGKAAASSANISGDNDSTQESGKPEESKKAKKKKAKAAKAKAEANESASEIEIPPVPAKAKKLKKAKKVAKKSEVSESEEESDTMSNSLSMSMPIPTPVLAPTATAESSLIYSSNASTNTTNTRSTSPLSQSTTIQYNSNGNEELLVSSNAAGRSSAASLIFNKVSQPSPLSSVSYVNYYDDTNINVHPNPHANVVKPNNTPLAQSPIIPIQTPNTPLFGPSSTTPKMDSPTMYSFTNGPSLTISTAPIQNNDNQNQVQEETIIDLFNRTNKSFRRPRSISLNSHFQPSNEVRSNLSPLLMSTFKNSSALKLDQPFLPHEQQFNNIKLNGNASSSLPFEAEAGLFNNNNLSTSYIPPMHSKSSDLINSNKETIPAQTTIKSGLSDFNDFGSGNMANPIIKKPTENVIQRYRRARTLSSPAVPPSVDKKNHFYSPFMTGLDIKYDFYIPKSNAISPLSSSFTASDSHTYEMNREETTRRRSQSINERNRPNINDF